MALRAAQSFGILLSTAWLVVKRREDVLITDQNVVFLKIGVSVTRYLLPWTLAETAISSRLGP